MFVFYDWPFPHVYFAKNVAYFPFNCWLAQFSATVPSFMGTSFSRDTRRSMISLTVRLYKLHTPAILSRHIFAKFCNMILSVTTRFFPINNNMRTCLGTTRQSRDQSMDQGTEPRRGTDTAHTAT